MYDSGQHIRGRTPRMFAVFEAGENTKKLCQSQLKKLQDLWTAYMIFNIIFNFFQQDKQILEKNIYSTEKIWYLLQGVHGAQCHFISLFITLHIFRLSVWYSTSKKNTLIIAVHITLWIHRLNLRYLTMFWNLGISFTKKSYQNLTRLRQRVTWRNQNILIMWVVGMRFGFLHSTPHKLPGTKKSALLKNISNLPPLMDRTSPIVSIRWNAPYFLPVLLMILWMQFMVLKVFCSHPKDGRLKDFSKHGPIMSIILTGHISANNYMFDCFGYHHVSG